MTAQPTVVAALAAVMEDVRSVAKDDFHNSPQAKFHFRGVDAVMNAVGPELRKHRVIVCPHQVAVNYRDVTTSGGKASRECTVMVTYRFHGPAGDYLDVMAPGEAMDSGDKGTAKAMSVAFRIALLQALCLPTDESDPDHDVYERGPAQPPAANGHSQKKEATPASWVKTLLEIGTEERAKTGLDAAQAAPVKDVDISPMLTQDDRERLPATENEVVTVVQLAEKVQRYVAKHKRAVRAPIEAGTL